MRPDIIPAPGTLARRVFDAIALDPVLSETTRRPGDFATRIVQPSAYPGVDVLAQVLRCGTWAATQAKRAVRNGNATLANWLAVAAEDAARAGPVALDGRHGPAVARAPPVATRGHQPAATAEDFARERGAATTDTTRPIAHGWRGARKAPTT